MKSKPLLEVENISYRYRRSEQPSLTGVSLTVERGQIYGLLGPNGAGKTTLISLIAGLLPIQSGGINLDGTSLADARRNKASMVAVVPQDYAFYPMLSVLENLRFFAGVQGIAGLRQTEQVEHAIQFCRLEQVIRKQGGQLSGGLRRRLNLAIGLLADPELLLLDEPTVGIDPQSRHFLLESIADLKANGKTIIYTSHYMDEVEKLCDSLAIIDHGKVLVQGALSVILTSETNRLDFQLQQPLSPSALTKLSTHSNFKDEGEASYELDIPISELANSITTMLEGGGDIVHLAYGKRNLEQIFMRLTKNTLRD